MYRWLLSSSRWVLAFLLPPVLPQYFVKKDDVATPCNFPVPSDKTNFAQCTYRKKAAVCDRDKILGFRGASYIDDFLNSAPVFESNRVQVGIAVLKQLILPDFNILFYARQDMRRNQPFCSRIDMLWRIIDHFQWNETYADEYADFFADHLRERWFDNGCPNTLLLLLVLDGFGGMDNGETAFGMKMPIFLLSTGPGLKGILNSVRKQVIIDEVSACLRHSQRHSDAIRQALNLIQNYVHRYDHSGGLDRTYNIPNWAVYTFIGSVSVCVLAMVLDWVLFGRGGLRSSLAGSNTKKSKLSGGILSAMISKKNADT